MRTKILIYELEDGFKGSAKEIANRLGVEQCTVFRANRLRRPLKGQKIKKIGYNYTPYRLYRNGVFTFEGSPEEIADKIYTTPENVLVALTDGRVMLNEYTVKRGDTVFVGKCYWVYIIVLTCVYTRKYAYGINTRLVWKKWWAINNNSPPSWNYNIVDYESY